MNYSLFELQNIFKYLKRCVVFCQILRKFVRIIKFA